MKIIYKKATDFDDFVVGIFEENDGSFTALTATQSKTFKTIKGAKRFLENRGVKLIGVVA